MAVRPSPTLGSKLGVSQIAAAAEAAREADCHLDLRECDLDGLDFGGEDADARRAWSCLIFGLNDRFPRASLAGCNFAHATLSWCFFVGVELHYLDFTESQLEDCDFRFATFRGMRLGSANFERCDLYGAAVQAATIATNIRFTQSSLPQFGDGITGLDWSCIAGRKPPPVASEDGSSYEAFLERTRHERPPQEADMAEAVDTRLLDAAKTYRRLSGYWMAQGQFRDANRAYAKSRRLERAAASPLFAILRRLRKEGSFRHSWRERRQREDRCQQRHAHAGTVFIRGLYRRRMLRPLVWLGLWVADVTSCFGQSLTRVAATLLVVAIVPGIAYSSLHGVSGAHGLADDLLLSVSRLTAYTPPGVRPVGRVVVWIGIVQSALGIGLIGLFGFVLGNVLRQS